MLKKSLGICSVVMLAVSLASAADKPAAKTTLTAEQVVDRNVEARGGLKAWRAVQSLSLQGKMGAGGNQRASLSMPMSNAKYIKDSLPTRRAEETELPFVMDLARSRKMRVEIQFKGQTAVQVYDGARGWKVRPFLNRAAVEPFSAEELKIASNQEELDGPLVDYAAKGSHVELDGKEAVEGHGCYKLKVTEKNGHTFHVWIDADTFLEAKMEGQPRRLDGTEHPVEVYYRDFRTVDGLRIPFLMETKVLPVAKNALGLRDTPVPPEKIVVDKVVVNPKLSDTAFLQPKLK